MPRFTSSIMSRSRFKLALVAISSPSRRIAPEDSRATSVPRSSLWLIEPRPYLRASVKMS